MKFSHYLLLGILLPALSFGQRATQRMYTMDDGLYQSTVNGIWMTYDSLFYVWDGSHDNGITRFDGYHFEFVDSCGISPYGLSLAYNFEELTYIDDRGVYVYQDGFFEKILDIKTIEETLYGHWIHDRYLYKATLDKKVYQYDIPSKKWVFNHDIKAFVQEKLDSIKQLLPESRGYYMESIDKRMARYKDRIKNFQYDLDSEKEIFPSSNNALTGIAEKENKKVVPYHWKEQYELFTNYSNYLNSLDDSTFCRAIQDKSGNFNLVEFNKNGIIDYGTIRGSNVIPLKLNAQAYYVSSHDGLQKVNPKIKYFPPTDIEMIGGLYSIMESSDGSIWMGGYGTGFSRYDGEKLEKIKNLTTTGFIMPGSTRLKNGMSLFLQDNASHGLYQLQGSTITHTKFKLPSKLIFQQGYIIKELSDHSIAVGNPKSTVSIITDITDPTAISYLSKEDGLKVRNVLCIEEDNQGRLWLGHPSTGVDLYDRAADIAYNYEISSEVPNSFGAMSMVIDKNDRLWMGSKQGLKVVENISSFDPSTQDLYTESRTITLPNGDFSLPMFVTEVDEYIVAGSQKAVSFIDKSSYASNPNHPIIYQLIYGEDIEGKGSQQNSVFFDSQRRLWIGSNEGASMILWDDYEWDQTKNKIDIKSIVTGTTPVQLNDKDEFELPKDNRNFQIEFGLKTNVSLLKNVFFDYYLLNENKDTLQQQRFDQKGFLKMAYVQPGSYTLYIEAKKHGQLMDTRIIKIKAPLSINENPFFWAGISVLFFGLFGGFLWSRSRQNKLLLEKQLELSKMQTAQQSLSVQAIISSFNPHFINNSLHWVQSKYRKDQEMATVVGRLSENTRYIFSQTKQGVATHSLRNELEIVDNYVKIQLVRFKDTFEYHPPSRESVERLGNSSIFLMMLQIHIENAIEHGLRNRKDSTYVSLNIEEEEHNILINIEDDGIGRKGAKEVGSKGTESGVQMLKDLIQIFNTSNNEKITMNYQDDIFENQGIKYGTLLCISIPKNYNFELK